MLLTALAGNSVVQVRVMGWGGGGGRGEGGEGAIQLVTEAL